MLSTHSLPFKGTMKTIHKLVALVFSFSAVLFLLAGRSDQVIEKHANFKSAYCQCSRRIPLRSNVNDLTIDWCSEESTLRGAHQNVVSYSLYGDSIKDNKTVRYYLILDSLPKLVKKFYPDWRMRIYHDIERNQSREHDILCEIYCKNDNVDLCDVNRMVKSFAIIKNETNRPMPILSAQLAKLNKMNWRYLPMMDPLVDRMVARDTDSELSGREIAAVHQWLESPYTFHVMRDHPGHKNQIMGGMFGIKVFQERRLIEGLMRSMIIQGTSHGFGFDQTMLTYIFWPTVKDDAMIHDSYYCEDDWNSLPISPYPTQRDPVTRAFVTDRNGSNWPRPPECPVACRPPNHKDWTHC